MRKPRGNVMLTALFVSVFLFFLSVALLYSNRQDIALSLSMEHQLKAEAAARSVAMEAFGQLREFGEIRRNVPTEPVPGVTARMQLVRTPAQENRGELLLLQVRATSGVVSSYLTFHLEESFLAEPEGQTSKVMLFPGGEESGAAYGDLVWTQLETSLPGGLQANGGPAFRAETVDTTSADQPAFRDNIPLFVPATGELFAFGPALSVIPAPTEQTKLQWLKLNGEQFDWVEIPYPFDLSGKAPEFEPPVTVLDWTIPGQGWSNASVQGVGDQLLTHTWRDPQPSAGSVEEIQDTLVTIPSTAPGPAKDWSGGGAPSEWFVLRGAVAPLKNDLYAHAWHYLYRPYSGGAVATPTALNGPVLTRWPCILKYTTEEGVWEKSWAPLDSSGDVSTDVVPDPGILLAGSEGSLFGVTVGERRLLTMTGQNEVDVGEVVPNGQLFLYRNQPYIYDPAEAQLGFRSLTDGSYLGFQTLPDRVPGVAGMLADFPQFQSLGIDEAGVLDLSSEGAIELPPRKRQVMLPPYLLNYQVADGAPIQTEGRNLWTLLDIEAVGEESIDPLWSTEWYKANKMEGGQAIARFDGDRWHILPNGLNNFLSRNRIDPPPEPPPDDPPPGNDLNLPPGASNFVVADYPGLPGLVPKYTIIAVEQDPFKFLNE